MWDTDLSKEPGVPKHPGSRQPQLGRLFQRAYECLGSKFNDDVFMIVQDEINDAKNFVGPLSSSSPIFLFPSDSSSPLTVPINRPAY
jgi:hypothetical protein